MIKPAQLDNYGLPEIINGKLGYAVEKRPFNYCFTYAKIFKSSLNIGFCPFTQALLYKNVRPMLGKGGGSDDRREIMEVQATYGKLKEYVKESGINSFVFHAKLPVHKHSSTLNIEDK